MRTAEELMKELTRTAWWKQMVVGDHPEFLLIDEKGGANREGIYYFRLQGTTRKGGRVNAYGLKGSVMAVDGEYVERITYIGGDGMLAITMAGHSKKKLLLEDGDTSNFERRPYTVGSVGRVIILTHCREEQQVRALQR
jgi:hypothetical protein